MHHHLLQAERIIADPDESYDSQHRSEDLRTIIREMEAEATENGWLDIVHICQGVRSGGVSGKLFRQVFSDCMAAVPPARPVPLMTVEEVASALNVSVRTVWRMKSAGELPDAVMFGKAVRWRQCDIETMVK